MSEIRNLVPAARNLVKVNKISDNSSKGVSSSRHRPGDELGSMLPGLGTKGSSPCENSAMIADRVDAQ